MNKFVAGAVLALLSSHAQAAGLDRSGQSITSLFASDNTASLSFGHVMPSVTGRDALGNSYDVGENYNQTSVTYTNGVSGTGFNYTLIFDEPYGANVDYDANPAASTLGGTKADLDSEALTFIARYKFGERFSVFGGIGVERIGADVALNGLAYRQGIVLSGGARNIPGIDAQTLGAAVSCTAAAARAGIACNAAQPLAQGAIDAATGGRGAAVVGNTATALDAFNTNGGYKFSMEDSTRPTYLLGAAYEIPDIALRVSGTYRFETSHSADTTEQFLGTTRNSSVDFVSPASFNLDFQTGIMEGTLLTASYRWTDFSVVDIIPTALNSDLVDLDDGHRYTLGVARRFSESFAGSMSISYEPENNNDTVSPLGPTDGLWGVSLGGQYSSGNLNISGGVNYSWLGDAVAGVADRPAATFDDNHVVGIGFKAEMVF